MTTLYKLTFQGNVSKYEILIFSIKFDGYEKSVNSFLDCIYFNFMQIKLYGVILKIIQAWSVENFLPLKTHYTILLLFFKLFSSIFKPYKGIFYLVKKVKLRKNVQTNV